MRCLGGEIWDRKLARLPDRGVLLVATDLQGNYEDYQTLKRIYAAEEAAGNVPILVLTGDLVHGPPPELSESDEWPDYLGEAYHDRSAELILDFERASRELRIFALLGNHEHSHIGGPVVSKFYADEAAVLDKNLGEQAPRVHEFIQQWPLVAAAPCGIVLCHGAPYATEPDAASFEALTYGGHERVPLHTMVRHGTVGALLWARYADDDRALRLIEVLLERDEGVVVFGHDVAPSGWDVMGKHLVCVSTSYGVHRGHKTYLRLDLSGRYRTTADLRAGLELRPLYPE